MRNGAKSRVALSSSEIDSHENPGGTPGDRERHGARPHEPRARSVAALTPREPRRSGIGVYLPWATTAILSVVLIAVGISGRRQIGDTAKFERALPILNDPAARDVPFGKEKTAKGRIFVSADKGIVFMGANLPDIGSGKTFELWVIPAKGMPEAAGLFRSQSDATAVFAHLGPVGNATAITVTVEPDGGSSQPTTTPFIVARL